MSNPFETLHFLGLLFRYFRNVWGQTWLGRKPEGNVRIFLSLKLDKNTFSQVMNALRDKLGLEQINHFFFKFRSERWPIRKNILNL